MTLEDVDPLSALDAYEVGSQKSHARSRRSRRSNKSRRSSAGTSVKSGSMKPSEMFDEEDDDEEEYSDGVGVAAARIVFRFYSTSIPISRLLSHFLILKLNFV